MLQNASEGMIFRDSQSCKEELHKTCFTTEARRSNGMRVTHIDLFRWVKHCQDKSKER